MLKKISAALLAVSVLAVPALAAATDKAAPPVTKSAQVSKPAQAKTSAHNANTKMGRHHVRHSSHRGVHKKMTMHKVHKSQKVAAKHVTHAAKHG